MLSCLPGAEPSTFTFVCVYICWVTICIFFEVLKDSILVCNSLNKDIEASLDNLVIYFNTNKCIIRDSTFCFSFYLSVIMVFCNGGGLFSLLLSKNSQYILHIHILFT